MLNWVENDKNWNADNGQKTPDKEMNCRMFLLDGVYTKPFMSHVTSNKSGAVDSIIKVFVEKKEGFRWNVMESGTVWICTSRVVLFSHRIGEGRVVLVDFVQLHLD